MSSCFTCGSIYGIKEKKKDCNAFLFTKKKTLPENWGMVSEHF